MQMSRWNQIHITTILFIEPQNFCNIWLVWMIALYMENLQRNIYGMSTKTLVASCSLGRSKLQFLCSEPMLPYRTLWCRCLCRCLCLTFLFNHSSLFTFSTSSYPSFSLSSYSTTPSSCQNHLVYLSTILFLTVPSFSLSFFYLLSF